MDGEAGWWTTSRNIGLLPLAWVMGVGSQQQYDIDDALDMIARVFKADVCETEYDQNMYKREISKSVTDESILGTLQLLLHKLCPALNADLLAFLHIGNMVTRVCHHTNPLQIALDVLMQRKKIIQHMYDYNMTCSYD